MRLQVASSKGVNQDITARQGLASSWITTRLGLSNFSPNFSSPSILLLLFIHIILLIHFIHLLGSSSPTPCPSCPTPPSPRLAFGELDLESPRSPHDPPARRDTRVLPPINSLLIPQTPQTPSGTWSGHDAYSKAPQSPVLPVFLRAPMTA